MQKTLSKEDIILLKKAYKADSFVFSLLIFIFLFGIGIIALESYHGDIPRAVAVSVGVSLFVSLVLGWRFKQRIKKDLAQGAFHTIEGVVNSSVRSSIKIGKNYYGFSNSIENPVKKGDKVRIYMTDATKMIFKVEKIIDILPDVI